MARWGLLVFLFSVTLAWADPATHGVPNTQRQQQVWMGDVTRQGYVLAGCLPPLPVSSLTLAIPTCEAYTYDQTTNELLYVAEGAKTLGPLPPTSGDYWLLLHVDTSTAVAGWTRLATTRWLWQASGSPPSVPTRAALIARVRVAGGVITAIGDFRTPRSVMLRQVFDPTDTLYGADPTAATDATAAIQAAEDARSVQTQGGTLAFPSGSFTTSAPIILRSGGTIQGQGPAKTSIDNMTATGDTVTTAGMAGGLYSSVTIRDLTFAAGVLKSAGAAVRAVTATPDATAQTGLRIENTHCVGHYDCFYLGNSIQAHIVSNQLTEVRGNGITMNTTSNYDAGDNVIAHNILTSSTGLRGMFLRSSGQRVIGNKINGFPLAIEVNPATTTGGIVDMLIANNSIENQEVYSILLQTSNPGTAIQNININSNQLAIHRTAGGTYIALSGFILNVTINDNQLWNSTTGTSGIGLAQDGTGTSPDKYTISNNVIVGAFGSGDKGIEVPIIAEIRGLITGNFVKAMGIPYAGSSATFQVQPVVAADLAAFGGPGSTAFCIDCRVTSGSDNTCINGGSGALALKLVTGSVWRCLATQN